MSSIIEPLARLINQLSKLPGIGGKSAQRLAFHIIGQSEEDVRELAEAIYYAKKRIKYCNICGGISETETCPICQDPNRDHSVICVVSDIRDAMSMERTRNYKGVYHVLGGCISPLQGRGPDDIRIKELIARIREGGVSEVILATNPDVEGDATSAYIAHLIKPFNIKVTRIAYGVPVGGNIEYIDEITLSKSLINRQNM
ncbi:MAG TPA: recombination mediator RecR [Clostridia bacterium]|nr:recombination mediator RecR [Clostridia bacterium]